MAAELESENWYYCALCDEHHETFRFVRDLSDRSAGLTYLLTCPYCDGPCNCHPNKLKRARDTSDRR